MGNYFAAGDGTQPSRGNRQRRSVEKKKRLVVRRKITDEYTLESAKLGQGSYGTVRTGVSLKTGKRVAVKMILKSRVKNVESLRREISIMKNANHQNIIKLLDAFEDAKVLFIVMELCTGGELFDYISQNGHYSESDAVVVFYQILCAVKYLHENKIAHRDLKPENFLFLSKEPDSSLKLIDFGLSQLSTDDDIKMQTRVGTPYYIAPEVLGKSYTMSCDMWSAGVILYVLLCGYPPFYGDTEWEIFQSIKFGSYDFPEAEWDSISPQAKDLISKLLLIDPSSRLSAKEALEHPWFSIHGGKLKCGEATVSFRKPSETVVVSETIGAKVLPRLKKFALQNKFKKAVLVEIARMMKPEDMEKLRDQFHIIDTDGDGVITVKELTSAIRTSGYNPSASEVERLMDSLDQDGNGKLDYQEFVSACLEKRIYLRDELLSLAFSHFASAGARVLTTQDIKTALGTEDSRVVEDIIKDIDKDSNGVIDFDEFKTMMASSGEYHDMLGDDFY